MMELFIEFWLTFLAVFFIGAAVGHGFGYYRGVKWARKSLDEEFPNLHKLSEQDQRTLESIGNKIRSKRQD